MHVATYILGLSVVSIPDRDFVTNTHTHTHTHTPRVLYHGLVAGGRRRSTHPSSARDNPARGRPLVAGGRQPAVPVLVGARVPLR